MADLIAAGEVWLVGAGPGDPDLLTRKAEALIRAASVIFHDALIGPGILDLVPRLVRLVAVGKRSGCHSATQDQINALLVEAALAGERVVRLKGGDPSIFGRSMEEMDALAAAGVPVRICPGITAASAAAASAGVSLSLRGAARQVRFVTAHRRPGEEGGTDWASLADRQTTLVFYMGRAAAREICRELIVHGLPAQTPVLIASDVSLAGERLIQTRLDLLPIAVNATAGSGPTLILVGEAARPRSSALPRSIVPEVVSFG